MQLHDVLRSGQRLLGDIYPAELEQPFVPPDYFGWSLGRKFDPYSSDSIIEQALHWFAVAGTMPLDVVHAALRYPLSAASRTIHKGEQFVWTRQSNCPYCFMPMHEPFVVCQDANCKTIQSSLSPAWGEVLFRRCAGKACKHQFPLHGNFAGKPSKLPLICRTTSSYFGCRRRMPQDVAFFDDKEHHVALCGPTTWKKMAVLSMLWETIAGGTSLAGWRGTAEWKQTQDEQTYLAETLAADPEELADSDVGYQYSVSRSGIFRIARNKMRRLLMFHNILEDWLKSDELVWEKCLHLEYDKALILVIDMDHPDLRHWGLLPHAQMYSRIIRCLERIDLKTPRSTFPGRVAVVQVFGAGEPERSSAELESQVRKADPQFWSLLNQTVGNRVDYFGGPVQAGTPDWIRGLLDFVMGD